MFDMYSSYCKNFICISLSPAMWHSIFENWRITKMLFQRKRSIPKNITQKTGALNSSFSREKSTLAEQYLAWTTAWIIKRWKRVQVALKRVKNSLERLKQLIRELNYQIIHSRGKVIPLNRYNEVLFL